MQNNWIMMLSIDLTKIDEFYTEPNNNLYHCAIVVHQYMKHFYLLHCSATTVKMFESKFSTK